mmetsp:Transcript_15417/g.51739  ORF Transcript_15417/g.51739 Transcript_15417/m.51739 type:complete len:292 (-) Transcript_15417:64-939(-)
MSSNTLSEKEAREMKAKLEKDGVDVNTVRDILTLLMDKEVPVQVLIETKIGVTVKSKRSDDDRKVAKLASELTSKWKEVVARSRQPGSSAAGQEKPNKSAAGEGSNGKEKVKSEDKVTKKPAEPVDGKRLKVRELFEKAFADWKGESDVDRKDLSARIESAMYEHFGGANEQYLNHAKSVKFNLSDPKNPDFRSKVIFGDIDAEEIPKLSSGQMAGKDKIEQKKANKEDKIFQDKMFITAGNLGAESDMFQCRKCKQKRTTFYQKQTRSADEPMTVFITCKNCGHEWRDGG